MKALVLLLSVIHCSLALAADKPAFAPKTLLRSDIKGVEGKEVIMSLVELPAGASSPLHFHPGEEFAFVVEGKAIQKIGDKPEETVMPGQVVHLPYGAHHYVRADGQPLKAIVFRIHQKGQPERTIVEEKNKVKGS